MNLRVALDLEYIIRNSSNEEARKMAKKALEQMIKKA